MVKGMKEGTHILYFQAPCTAEKKADLTRKLWWMVVRRSGKKKYCDLKQVILETRKQYRREGRKNTYLEPCRGEISDLEKEKRGDGGWRWFV
jgi:hypothetical protein